jgi:hypothetical protein
MCVGGWEVGRSTSLSNLLKSACRAGTNLQKRRSKGRKAAVVGPRAAIRAFRR